MRPRGVGRDRPGDPAASERDHRADRAAALLLRVVFERSGLAEVAIAGIAAFAAFLLALGLRGGIGMGDVKLAAMLGFLLGSEVVPALAAGILLGGVWAVALVAARRVTAPLLDRLRPVPGARGSIRDPVHEPAASCLRSGPRPSSTSGARCVRPLRGRGLDERPDARAARARRS